MKQTFKFESSILKQREELKKNIKAFQDEKDLMMIYERHFPSITWEQKIEEICEISKILNPDFYESISNDTKTSVENIL